MSRRTPAAAALVALAALTLGLTANADAASADSVGLFGARDGSFQAVSGVSGKTPKDTHFFDLGGSAASTSVNPKGGKDGIVCKDGSLIKPVEKLRGTPRLASHDINASAYVDEGGVNFNFNCEGVAVHGDFGLAAGDSQGLLQLRRKNGVWKIDKRVQSPGLNDGFPRVKHQPGWIDFPDSVTKSVFFTGVVIASKALPSGKFLALSIDRDNGVIVVVKGVGTAHPKVVGALDADAIARGDRAFGNGGMAFLPTSPDKAVVTTETGFAVLDLSNPAEPRLRVKTTIGDGSVEPSSITVSSDGDHVAVARGGKVYGYRNVLAAAKHRKPFKHQTTFDLSDLASERVSDVAYTGNDTLAVLHGDELDATAWALTLVKKVPQGDHRVRGSLTTTEPDEDGTLSVWPAP